MTARSIALAIAGLALAGCAEPPRSSEGYAPLDTLHLELDQGWTPGDIAWFNSVSQGSRLIPRAWFEALEQSRSRRPFAEANHIASYRYLPRDGDLPVGFAEDRQSDAQLSPDRTKLRWFTGQGDREPWVGMTCAACHTGQVSHKGRTLTVVGGPTLADYQGLIGELNAALVATARDAARFDRFAAKVNPERDTPANRELLRDALGRLIAYQTSVAVQNGQDRADRVSYGYGRLDALGHIVNKVTLLAGGLAAPAAADAPVSYPALWNTPQFDRVEWNGLVRNTKWRPGGPDLGALIRNTGQVIGVFGDVVPNGRPGDTAGFRSSVEADALISVERSLNRLRPPAWPVSLLGPLDAAKRERGGALFTRHCASCHGIDSQGTQLTRSDLATSVRTTLTWVHEVGTDIWMACNVHTSRVPTGVLRGVPDKIYVGPRLAASESGVSLMKTTILGALLAEISEVRDRTALDALSRPQRPAEARMAQTQLHNKSERATFCLAASREQARREAAGRLPRNEARLAYKARPLTGIWATAPYLHNGSVPTLHALLSPPQDRPRRFFIGSIEFDPAKVGFVTAKSAANSFEFDTWLDGNSNMGHEYGTTLPADDRDALIEYLKSL